MSFLTEGLYGETMKYSVVQAYESSKFNRALNESLHPGGLELTNRTAELAGIGKKSMVLDIASGRGSTACFLAQTRGCFVHGIDLSQESISIANKKAAEQGVSDLVQFHFADAVNLPFKNSFFEVVFCECAFSLLSDKQKGVEEIARVLKKGGRLAFNDVFLRNQLSDELKNLTPFNSCFTQAETIEGYDDIFRRVNLVNKFFEDHSQAMLDTTALLKKEYGSLASFWEQFGSGKANTGSCSCCSGGQNSRGYGDIWKRMIAEGDPGYCLMILEKA